MSEIWEPDSTRNSCGHSRVAECSPRRCPGCHGCSFPQAALQLSVREEVARGLCGRGWAVIGEAGGHNSCDGFSLAHVSRTSRKQWCSD